MKKFIPLLLIPLSVYAEQCVLQQKTVTQTTAVIQERTNIKAEVVPAFGGSSKCLVSFRARIDNTWHTAFGEYEWPGDRSREQACAVALRKADESLKERVNQSRVLSENTLVCREDPSLNTLRETNPGTIGSRSQFRPHPDRPKEFWHNGARCRYFLESNYTGRDIKTFEGIICLIIDDQWVVVDKF